MCVIDLLAGLKAKLGTLECKQTPELRDKKEQELPPEVCRGPAFDLFSGQQRANLLLVVWPSSFENPMPRLPLDTYSMSQRPIGIRCICIHL